MLPGTVVLLEGFVFGSVGLRGLVLGLVALLGEFVRGVVLLLQRELSGKSLHRVLRASGERLICVGLLLG